MRNLFVLHTQYNIILGTALVSSKFKEDNNNLILYAEFKLSENLLSNLKNIFDDVLIISDRFIPSTTKWFSEEIRFYKQYLKYKNSSISKGKYDNVLLSQDRELDCLIVGDVLSRNENCVCADIEEDCYFSLDSRKNELDYCSTIPLHSYFKLYLRKLIYGHKYLYNNRNYFYGQSKFFKIHYALFPELLRPQIKETSKIDISEESIVDSINKLYSNKVQIPSAKGYYLFFFDLIERYKDLSSIKQIVETLMKISADKNMVFLAKYHPRETNKFKVFGNAFFEIPYTIPAEKLLTDLIGTKTIVIGNATTAIMVAKKLCFESICIAKLNGFVNKYLLDKYTQMGIKVIEKVDDL